MDQSTPEENKGGCPMLAALTCRTIGDLKDGLAEKVIDDHIRRAVADLENRGNEDGKPRKVVITIDMIKMAADVLIIDVLVDLKLPPSRVPTTTAASKRRVVGGVPVDDLLFQTAN